MSTQLEVNMRKTTEAFSNSFNGSWEPGASMQYRAPECTHTMLPTSLGIAPKNNDEWAAHFESVAPMVTGGKMTIKDYVAAPTDRRVVCYTALDSTTTLGPYQNEYIWFIRFDESGEKITEIVEFLDSKATAEIVSRRQAAN